MMPCVEHCIYQRDGTCNLRHAAAHGGTKNECAHYVEVKKRGGR